MFALQIYLHTSTPTTEDVMDAGCPAAHRPCPICVVLTNADPLKRGWRTTRMSLPAPASVPPPKRPDRGQNALSASPLPLLTPLIPEVSNCSFDLGGQWRGQSLPPPSPPFSNPCHYLRSQTGTGSKTFGQLVMAFSFWHAPDARGFSNKAQAAG